MDGFELIAQVRKSKSARLRDLPPLAAREHDQGTEWVRIADMAVVLWIVGLVVGLVGNAVSGR